jgi:hypothetical protein
MSAISVVSRSGERSVDEARTQKCVVTQMLASSRDALEMANFCAAMRLSTRQILVQPIDL